MRIHISNKQGGFTLIEVMVAMFILTIGMLGSTSMMLRSQLKAEETNIEATAAQRVWNIAELLRANVADVNAANFDKLVVAEPATAPTPPSCFTSGCTGAALVGVTQYLIGIELYTYLKNKNSSVSITKLSGTAQKQDLVFDINLSWDELDKAGVTYTKNYQMVFQP
ncbi:hypothetical protein MNBD_GAMMA09-1209 [hydrothermal vent metagenome]|uniref:Type IV fimbrial biogenesis protein PilV n=1 Tax=hydrothermal vent metagenome TaxID=652676 RepID=A0A3B0Y1U6_9ZZZZ